MKNVTANEEMLASLRNCKSAVQVRDTEGYIVGYFVPFVRERAHLYHEAFAQLEPSENGDDGLVDLREDFDLGEVEKMLASNEGKGVTLVGVYEYLLDITPEPQWREHLQKQIDRLKERDRCDIQ
jgi:hypothetical protein